MHFLILTRRGILLSALAGCVLGIVLALAGLLQLVGMLLLFAALPLFAVLAVWWYRSGRNGRRPSARLQAASRAYLYAVGTCIVSAMAAWLVNAVRIQSVEGYVEKELVQKLQNHKRLKGAFPESLDDIEAGEVPWSGFPIRYRSDGEYYAITFRLPGEEGVREFNSAAGKWGRFDD